MSLKPRPKAEGIERAYQEPKGSMLRTTGFLTEFNGGWVFFTDSENCVKGLTRPQTEMGFAREEGPLFDYK